MDITEEVAETLTAFIGESIVSPDYALVFMNGLKNRGLTIVPLVPTEEMCLAGDAEIFDAPPSHDIRDVYKAMVGD